jgi:hypothetical protein
MSEFTLTINNIEESHESKKKHKKKHHKHKDDKRGGYDKREKDEDKTLKPKRHKLSISPSRRKLSISPTSSFLNFHHDKDDRIAELTEENLYLMKEVNQLREDYSYLKDKYTLLGSEHSTLKDLNNMMKNIDHQGKKYVTLLHSVGNPDFNQWGPISDSCIVRCDSFKELLDHANDYRINWALGWGNIVPLPVYCKGIIIGNIKMRAGGDSDIYDLNDQKVLIY